MPSLKGILRTNSRLKQVCDYDDDATVNVVRPPIVRRKKPSRAPSPAPALQDTKSVEEDETRLDKAISFDERSLQPQDERINMSVTFEDAVGDDISMAVTFEDQRVVPKPHQSVDLIFEESVEMSINDFMTMQSKPAPEEGDSDAEIADKDFPNWEESSCPTLYDKATAKNKVKEEEIQKFELDDDDDSPTLYDKKTAKQRLKAEAVAKKAAEKAAEKAEANRKKAEEKAEAERKEAEKIAKAEREAAETAEKIAQEEEVRRKERLRKIAEKTAKERLQQTLKLVEEARKAEHKLDHQFARQFTVAKVKATPKDKYKDPNDRPKKIFVPPPIRARMKLVDDYGLARGHSGEYGEDYLDEEEEESEREEEEEEEAISEQADNTSRVRRQNTEKEAKAALAKEEIRIVEVRRELDQREKGKAELVLSEVQEKERPEADKKVEKVKRSRKAVVKREHPFLGDEPQRSGIWEEVKELAADIKYTFSDHPNDDISTAESHESKSSRTTKGTKSSRTTKESKSSRGWLEKKRSKRRKSKRRKSKGKEDQEEVYADL